MRRTPPPPPPTPPPPPPGAPPTAAPADERARADERATADAAGVLPVDCPALPGWRYVAARREAVALEAPCRIRMRYGDMGWIVERTFEAGGGVVAHALTAPIDRESDCHGAMLAILGLDR